MFKRLMLASVVAFFSVGLTACASDILAILESGVLEGEATFPDDGIGTTAAGVQTEDDGDDGVTGEFFEPKVTFKFDEDADVDTIEDLTDALESVTVELPDGTPVTFTSDDFSEDDFELIAGVLGVSGETTVGDTTVELTPFTFDALALEFLLFAAVDSSTDEDIALQLIALGIDPDSPLLEDSSMPTTGGATYSGQLFGGYIEPIEGEEGVVLFTADVSASADFESDGGITGSATGFEFANMDGESTDFTDTLDFDFAGSISGSEFTADITPTGEVGLTGSMEGFFSGIDAGELGAVFEGTAPSGEVIGVVGAVQDTAP